MWLSGVPDEDAGCGTPGKMRNVAFSYDPAVRRWRTLSPPRGTTGSYEGTTSAVWTGKALLVWGGDPLRSQVAPPDDWWPLLDGATFTPKA